MKVTIADVAALAGVGKGTVSRVLNESPAVSPATRTKVLAAISELDYTPSALARGLSRGRCQTVGVIVPFFTHAPSVAERLRGVVGALDGSRYDLVLYNVESALHRNDHFATLSGRDRADGLLVMSLEPPAGSLERLQRRGVPVVLLDAPGDLAPSVRIDDVDGGRRATDHLIGLGHTRIGFMGGEPENPLGFSPSRAREEGFRSSMAEAGLKVRDEDIAYLPYVHDLNAEVAARLLSRPAGERPTAIFAASDDLALGVIDAARDLGLVVPDDVSLVGFDDLEIARYVGLTTVRQPLYDMGRRAAELLLDALESEAPVPVKAHQLDVELVIRATTTTSPPGQAGLS